MKKILLFSVVLLTYTLGNAQNGTQTNKSTSSSSPAKLNERTIDSPKKTTNSTTVKTAPSGKHYEKLDSKPFSGEDRNARRLETQKQSNNNNQLNK